MCQLHHLGFLLTATGKKDGSIVIFLSLVDAVQDHSGGELGFQSGLQFFTCGHALHNILDQDHPFNNLTSDFIQECF